MLCFAGRADGADRRSSLRFRKQVDLPDLGLRIKLMPDTTETPLPPPSVTTFRNSLTGETTEMYPPLVLWQRSQHGGRWTDNNGNVLHVAEVTMPFPMELMKDFVTQTEFNASIAEQAAAEPEWTLESLSEWAAFFAGATSAEMEVLKHPSNLLDLYGVQLRNYPAEFLAFLFRLNPRSSGQFKAPSTWFFVGVQLASGEDPDKARKAVIEDFMSSVTVSKTAPPNDDGPSQKFQNRNVKSTMEKTPDFASSRKQVADSIRNMKDWWYVETDNFIILSNLKTKYRTMVKDLQSNIEYLRSACVALVPPRKDIVSVSVIRVFGSPEEYENYVPPDFKWSAGMWIAEKKELVVRPIDWGSSVDLRAHVFHSTYHEAFHQYLFYAMDHLEISPWFNEGHAEFFGNATVKDDKLMFKEDGRAVKKIEGALMTGDVNLRRLISISTYEEFYGGGETARERNYSLAWALIYYLRKGTAVDQRSPYSKILDAYVEALWTTRDPGQATEDAFKGVNMGELEKDFARFWKSTNKRSSAERKRIPGESR